MENLELYNKKRFDSFKVNAYVKFESIDDEASSFSARDVSSPNFKLEISEPALIVKEVEEICSSYAEEREKKILSLKKKIREGTYSPPSLKVAGKVIKKLLHQP